MPRVVQNSSSVQQPIQLCVLQCSQLRPRFVRDLHEDVKVHGREDVLNGADPAGRQTK